MSAVITAVAALSGRKRRMNSATAPAVSPRRANWFSSLFARGWLAMEASGRARAERELLELAQRYESTQPSFAAELRSAASQVS